MSIIKHAESGKCLGFSDSGSTLNGSILRVRDCPDTTLELQQLQNLQDENNSFIIRPNNSDKCLGVDSNYNIIKDDCNKNSHFQLYNHTAEKTEDESILNEVEGYLLFNDSRTAKSDIDNRLWGKLLLTSIAKVDNNIESIYYKLKNIKNYDNKQDITKKSFMNDELVLTANVELIYKKKDGTTLNYYLINNKTSTYLYFTDNLDGLSEYEKAIGIKKRGANLYSDDYYKNNNKVANKQFNVFRFFSVKSKDNGVYKWAKYLNDGTIPFVDSNYSYDKKKNSSHLFTNFRFILKNDINNFKWLFQYPEGYDSNKINLATFVNPVKKVYSSGNKFYSKNSSDNNSNDRFMFTIEKPTNSNSIEGFVEGLSNNIIDYSQINSEHIKEAIELIKNNPTNFDVSYFYIHYQLMNYLLDLIY